MKLKHNSSMMDGLNDVEAFLAGREEESRQRSRVRVPSPRHTFQALADANGEHGELASVSTTLMRTQRG